MILLDSSVWIEHLSNGPRLTSSSALFSDPDRIVVSTVSLYEVGRYTLRTSGLDAMEEVVAHMRQCKVVPVDEHIALRAVFLAGRHGLHTADALIAATAESAAALLFTLDSHLLALPGSREP
ncbi:MAG TPA: PIN domain-containing protein [Thermoanaerobaculia bacterium]|nr:PIN domain-containing protein [Thermoanaerobaculia bacterium]